MIGESQIAKYATKLYRVTAQGWNAGLLWLVSRAGLSCMPLSTNWAVICDNKDEWRAAVWGVKQSIESVVSKRMWLKLISWNMPKAMYKRKTAPDIVYELHHTVSAYCRKRTCKKVCFFSSLCESGATHTL